jgi:hypothetical protein
LQLSAAFTYTIPDDTGVLIVEYLNAANSPSFTTPTFVPGKRWTLVLHNNRASDIVSLGFSFGSGVSAVQVGFGSGAGSAPNYLANTYTVIEFVGLYVNGKGVWYGAITAYDVTE